MLKAISKYLPFYVNQRFTKALNDNVQLGIFGTLAPHDEKNYRNHRYNRGDTYDHSKSGKECAHSIRNEASQGHFKKI